MIQESPQDPRAERPNSFAAVAFALLMLYGGHASAGHLSDAERKQLIRLGKVSMASAQAADMALTEALRTGDRQKIQRDVLNPLEKIDSMWKEQIGLADRKKATVQGCLMLSADLETYVRALPGMPAVAEQARRYYEEDLAFCTEQLLDPEKQW